MTTDEGGDTSEDDPVDPDTPDADLGEDVPVDLPEDGDSDTADAADSNDSDYDVYGSSDGDAGDLPDDITDARDTDLADDGPSDTGIEELDLPPPSPPSSVSASDGTNTDFVAVTWAGMLGVTEFRVLRDGGQVGVVDGGANSFWDTGADASVPKTVAPVASAHPETEVPEFAQLAVSLQQTSMIPNAWANG